MDGWMDGWMNEWMDGWMEGWIDGWIDGWVCVCVDGRIKLQHTSDKHSLLY